MPEDRAFIPLTRGEVEALTQASLPSEQQQPFATFARILRAWFHHASIGALDTQKADLAELLNGTATPATSARFATSLRESALAANFRPISEAMLTEALAEESTFRIRLEVDFSHFEEVVFYGRGSEAREAEISQWFGLKRTLVQFTNFHQVLVFLRFNHHERLDENLRGQTVLKLFANVPQADLEMLFPNSEVRMRLSDKLFIGVPAFVSGLVVLFTKLGSALLLAGGLLAFWIGLSDREVQLDQAALVGLVSAAGALGGYLWKQFSNFKNRKIRFMKALTERLYFKNLDNNAGVLTALADHAEESECKETLLAYAALLKHGALSADAIKDRVETLLDPANVSFDIEDALSKLASLEIAFEQDGLWHPLDIQEAVAAIDRRWDALFDASQAAH